MKCFLLAKSSFDSRNVAHDTLLNYLNFSMNRLRYKLLFLSLYRKRYKQL